MASSPLLSTAPSAARLGPIFPFDVAVVSAQDTDAVRSIRSVVPPPPFRDKAKVTKSTRFRNSGKMDREKAPSDGGGKRFGRFCCCTPGLVDFVPALAAAFAPCCLCWVSVLACLSRRRKMRLSWESCRGRRFQSIHRGKGWRRAEVIGCRGSWTIYTGPDLSENTLVIYSRSKSTVCLL